ncbi:MFS transporter, partial [Candidatus Cyanaurora vandensis]
MTTLRYSMASLGINLLQVAVATWLLYFWAPPPEAGRTVYLAAPLVGVLLTVGRLVDALVDPWIGRWSDQSRGPWGRRKPFLLLAAPVAVVALVLLWTPPMATSGWVNGLYFGVVSTVFYGALSCVGIPYDSTLPELATTPQARLNLSTWKNVLGTLGVLIGAIITAPLF